MNRLGYPEIKADDIDIKSVLPFNYALTSKDTTATVHFYIDDYQFERIWKSPTRYIDLLRRFNGCLTPDFSINAEMPLAMQIWQIYRSRELGRIFQEAGIKVIPTITWSDEKSYEFMCVGVEKYSTVTISTMGCVKAAKVNKHGENLFLKGYKAMLSMIEPKKIIVYGGHIEGMEGNIEYWEPFYKTIKRRKLWVDAQAVEAVAGKGQAQAVQEAD